MKVIEYKEIKGLEYTYPVTDLNKLGIQGWRVVNINSVGRILLSREVEVNDDYIKLINILNKLYLKDGYKLSNISLLNEFVRDFTRINKTKNNDVEDDLIRVLSKIYDIISSEESIELSLDKLKEYMNIEYYDKYGKYNEFK